ncbi:MAG: hypothetical protein RIC85_04100 [Gammaproteobacteria bacterium]
MADGNYLDSEILGTLRPFLELYPTLKQLTGQIAQFKIVIDANMALADLLHKHAHAGLRQTAIEEAVKSSAIELHAPTWLDKEMIGSAIPQVSRKKGIPESALLTLWAEYKEQIIWDDAFSAPAPDDTTDGDSKDVPYVALQRSVSAAAILSRDKDIDDLGGQRVDLEFVLSVRTYARATSYVVGIRVGGVFVTWISVGMLAQIVKLVVSSISRLPDGVKFALMAVVAFVVIHPQSRERILALFKDLGVLLADAWPEIEALIELATTKQIEAEAALANSEKLLSP